MNFGTISFAPQSNFAFNSVKRNDLVIFGLESSSIFIGNTVHNNNYVTVTSNGILNIISEDNTFYINGTPYNESLNITNLEINSNINIGGSAFINTLDVTNNTTLSTLETSGKATFDSLEVTNNTSLLSALAVAGNTTLSTLETSGKATLDSLEVTNNTSLLSGCAVSGIFVNTSNCLLNKLDVSDLATFCNIDVDGEARFNSNIYVENSIECENLYISSIINPTSLVDSNQVFNFFNSNNVYIDSNTSNIGFSNTSTSNIDNDIPLNELVYYMYAAIQILMKN